MVTGETIEYPMAAKAVDGLSSVAGLVGFIAAGIMLRNYEKRGVWVGLSVIGAQFVLGLVSFQLGTPISPSRPNPCKSPQMMSNNGLE